MHRSAEWLKRQNHEIFSIFDAARGMPDEEVIQKAIDENWILITNDKDFGEKVFRDGRLHKGIILLRLQDERASSKISTLSAFLRSYSDSLTKSFIVLTEKRIRIARM